MRRCRGWTTLRRATPHRPTSPPVASGPWTRHSRRVAYENPWITIWHDEVTRPDGEPGIYGVVHFANLAAGVLVLDDEDRVLLVGQHRYALDEYAWEIPEGGVPAGETALEGARRELVEETGVTATDWRELARVHLSNSVSDELAVLFVASGLTHGVATPDGTEDLEVRWLPFDEVLAMTLDGRISDVMTVVAVERLALQRARASGGRRRMTDGRRDWDAIVVGLGGIGSGAAYWLSRSLGAGVLGLERFEMDHANGASADHSRIIRLSYHRPDYVRLAKRAYETWAEVEAEAGAPVVTTTGGLDLWPADAVIPQSDYTDSLAAEDVPFELLDATEIRRRWPQWRIADDVTAMWQGAGRPGRPIQGQRGPPTPRHRSWRDAA